MAASAPPDAAGNPFRAVAKARVEDREPSPSTPNPFATKEAPPAAEEPPSTEEGPSKKQPDERASNPFRKDGPPPADDEEEAPASSRGHGAWSTGVCSCCRHDGLLSCIVCFCGCITVGQLYQRATRQGMLHAQPCVRCGTIALFLLFCTVASYAIDGYMTDQFVKEFEDYADEDDEDFFPSVYGLLAAEDQIVWAIGNVLGAAGFICSAALVCSVRQAMRRRDSIREARICCEAGCEDCCCAVFCGPCTQCQMLRHEQIGSRVNYELCSPEATFV